jgi:hypothetical protein
VLFSPKQQKSDGMQSEIANKESVTFPVLEKGSRFVSMTLAQEHFKEKVGIDKQSHSPLILQRAIWCCSSTDVKRSPKSLSAPAQVNRGFSRGSPRCVASKDST